MLTRVLVVSSIAAAVLVPMQAQQQARFQQWLNEEVHWIITDEEQTAFQRLQTDDERQTFIDMFWLRRDPTPETPVNEFREELYRRVQWANDRFGGSNTDRGMVYVRFGAPDQRDVYPTSENWIYRSLEGVGSNVLLQFVNSDGNGFVLSPGDRSRLSPVGKRAANAPGSTNIFERMQAMDLLVRRPRP